MKTKSIAIAIVSFLLITLSGQTASASTSVSYDFNSAGDLSSGFNSYISSGTVVESVTGGIGNTGSINVSSQSSNAVFASKASYSLGPVGSTYRFTSFLQSVGNNGYSGMGFTALTPSQSNASVSASVYRPNDALGISVHGGGFVFHNGASNFSGSWNSNNSNISTVKTASINDLLNSGSPTDKWYKVVLVITRTAATTFTMRVEIWPSAANGTLLRPNEADAIFELRNVTNSSLSSAASINTYLNFSGDRVRFFDDYQVSLAGGSTVIQAGAPVVLTVGAQEANNQVSLSGNVSGTGGASVSERGFVYSTNPNPTISDNKVVVGSGVGTYSSVTSQLPDGTYFFRAFATNSNGTSYGVTEQITLSGGIQIANPPSNSGSNTVASSSPQLAATGGVDVFSYFSLIALVISGGSFFLISRRFLNKRGLNSL